MAKTPRTWTGARTPSGLKRVRQAARRHDILGPRRTAAKTYVAKALSVAANPSDSEATTVALIDALSALDRAAKAGAIHPNAAARRKSRLTIKVNAALGGTQATTSGRVTKVTGKTAAAKAAKARIAAGKSVKAKGAQTAAGKARAALSKSARAEAAAAKAAEAAASEGATAAATKPSKPATKASATKTDGRQEVDSEVVDQGQRREGRSEEDRQQELTGLASASPTSTAPGSTRGVVMSRPGRGLVLRSRLASRGPRVPVPPASGGTPRRARRHPAHRSWSPPRAGPRP